MRFKGFILTVFALCLPHLGAYAQEANQAILRRWSELKPYPTRQEMLTALGSHARGLLFQSGSKIEELAREDLKVLDQQYRLLFPKLMTNKSFPDFVVFQEDDISATQMFKPRFSPYGVVMIPTGLYASNISQEIRMGILAHELAHIYLAHNDVDTNVLSLSEVSALPALTEYLRLAEVGGFFPDKELGGFPWEGDLMSSWKNYLNDLSAAGENQGQSCGSEVMALAKDKIPMLAESFDPLKWNYTPTTEQRLKNEALINNIKTQAIQCSKKLKFNGTKFKETLFILGGVAWPLTSERYIQLHFQKDFKWADQNELEIIFKIGDSLHQKMRQLADEYKLNELTWRSFEDEADDFSFVVVRSLKLNAAAYIDMFFEQVGDESTKSKCYEKIRAGAPISFGAVASAHHSVCYRAKRMYDLSNDPNFMVEP